MSELGRKIRKRRKELKMTLEQLGGDRLSKGMVSLIENGRSMPSMESLHYLAEQLNVTAESLLARDVPEEAKTLLAEMEMLFDQQDREAIVAAGDLALIETWPVVWETARIIDLKARVLFQLERYEESGRLATIAIRYFEDLSLYSHALSASVTVAAMMNVEGKYEESLNYIRQCYTLYKEKAGVLDRSSEMYAMHSETISLLALDRIQEMNEVTDRWLQLARRSNVYYLMDHAYRLRTFGAIFEKNEHQAAYFLKKSMQFAEFIEDDFSMVSALLTKIEVILLVSRRFEEGLEVADQIAQLYKRLDQVDKEHSYYLATERMKLFCELGRYEDAIELYENTETKLSSPFPLDQAIMWIAESYYARCLYHTGRKDEAVRHAQQAVKQVSLLSNTVYRTVAEEALAMVKESDRNE